MNLRKGVDLHFFLGALQSQGVDAVAAWDWGPLENARFLPRVSFGKIVLHRARWRLDAPDLKALAEARGLDRFLVGRALRASLRMPRFMKLLNGDNELTVDWENPLLVDAFVAIAGKSNFCALAEMFPTPSELVCEGAGGRYAHEMVVSFVRREPLPIAPSRHKVTRSRSSFLPGGACLFLKLYGGRVSLESALARTLAPVIREAVDQGSCERWFFLRYADPHVHFRLRFFGARDALHERLLPRLHEAAEELRGAGQLWKTQLDTYVPETVRYGGPVGLEISEQLFHLESAAVLEILELLGGDEGESARWHVALRGVDSLLDDLGLPWDDKRALIQRMRDSFGREFSADTTPLKHELGAKFRTHRATIERVLDASSDEESELAPFLDVLGDLSRRREPVVVTLREQSAKGALTREISALAESYVHMFLNRLLRLPSRPQELAVYDFLVRAYASRAARAPRTAGSR